MKLKFKKQAFQTRAMETVVDCFKGQLNTSGISYRIDPGIEKTDRQGYYQQEIVEIPGFKNAVLQGLKYKIQVPAGNH